jgi:hypothetical protein
VSIAFLCRSDLNRMESLALQKHDAICVCTCLGLDLRIDEVATTQRFAHFLADPTGRAA